MKSIHKLFRYESPRNEVSRHRLVAAISVQKNHVGELLLALTAVTANFVYVDHLIESSVVRVFAEFLLILTRNEPRLTQITRSALTSARRRFLGMFEFLLASLLLYGLGATR